MSKLNKVSDGGETQKQMNRFGLHPWGLAALVLSLGLLFTTWLWVNARQAAIAELKAEFDFRVVRIENHIKERISHYGQALHSVQALYEGSDKVERHELKAFIAAINDRQLYRGVHYVGLTMLVPAERLAQHVAEMRRQGLLDYVIRPEGRRPVFAVVAQHEQVKQEPKVNVLGYDQFSDPERRAVMEKARDSNAIALTGKVDLQGRTTVENGARILMFLPIYRNGVPHETVEERRTNVTGWVFAPLYMNDAMTGMADEITANLGVEIYDGEISDKTRLFDSTDLPSGSHEEGVLGFRIIRKVEFGGSTWTLVMHSIPAFEARLNNVKPHLILGIGLALSVLLAILTWLLGTGRAHAQEQAHQLTADLKESESRFRLMADAAPAMIWMSDANRKRLWVNRGWLDFVGAINLDDFNRRWKTCIHPDDANEYEAIRSAAHERREPFNSEYRVRSHDGQYRWLMSAALPRFNDEGEFLGLIGSAIDITARKQAEEKLTQSALMFQNSSEVMLIADIDAASRESVVADINPAFTSLIGYAPDEIIGKNTKLLRSDKHDQAFFESMESSVREAGGWQGEYYALCKNGATRLGWLIISAIFDEKGRMCKYVSIFRDITEQKATEEELRLAALVYQNSSDAMMVFDIDPKNHTSKVVDVNPAFTSVTGYARDEVIGQGPDILRPEQYSPEFYAAMQKEFFSTGRWQGEFIRVRKNGGRSITWLSLHAIYDDKGMMTRYVSISRDISKQKEDEETIRALTTSLIMAKEEEARRIAREIHDDLGQRLSWLRMNLALLPKLVSRQPEQIADAVERMKESVEHILSVVRNISTNLRPATLDMGFIMAVQWQIENFRANTGIECRLDNRMQEGFNLPDERSTGVFRILQEALTNVARYAQASCVEVTLTQQSGNLVMEIMDNGIGFDPAQQRKSRSTGLAGMRERTTMLGGAIEFVSTPGHGTTVRLTITLDQNLH
ncbi:MAG: hypothetical protein H6R01_312 [Burkholderiaceae bacterium]|nr:hypothetical protein [Burkholderiaceae bacterium]